MAGSSQQTNSSNWRQIVTSLYPDALTRTYCVPPVHFNRVPYDRITVPGTGHSALRLRKPGAAPAHNVPPTNQRPVPPSRSSLWTQEPDPQAIPENMQESDLRDDFAQNHVMQNLQELGNSRHEAMFLLSQLSFSSYLNQPAYAAAATKFSRPSDLDTIQTRYSDGEADFLLINRQHGILIGELKSVGKTQACAQNPQPPADADVAKRVTKAVKQLDKSETVVRHLVSDVAPGLTVRKTLFLPYVSTSQLERVLDNHPQLEQAVCKSLVAANTAEAVQLCCCSDQLSQPASYSHVTPAVLSQLSTWWQHRMACTVDTLLTDDKYLDIVVRFVGPATTVYVPCYNGVRVEVRTAGQAVAELGWRLALLVLTLQQLDLLNRKPPLVCLTGPPGTGKTLVLVLQGLAWLLQGHDVQVVTTTPAARAISKMISEQLRQSLRADPTPPPTPGAVVQHHYDFTINDKDVEKAVTELLTRVKQGRLYILLDEALFHCRNGAGLRNQTLVTRLTESVPGLHLWAANFQYNDIPPSLRPEPLTVSLRCAPSVRREVQQAVDMSLYIHNYSDSDVPVPGDGLRVTRLSHHGNAHRGRWPVDCVECGNNIAAELRRLGVGSKGSRLANSPTPLSYRDVFIITRSFKLQDDVKDKVTSPASGVVRGLRAEGLPVCVLGGEDWINYRRDALDVAVAATDRVTVTHGVYVHGLERRVVVVLPCREEEIDRNLTDDHIDLNDKLIAASRCTTQLIMVDVPPPSASTPYSNINTNNTSSPGQSEKAQKDEKKDNSDPSSVSWVKKKGFLL